MRHVELTRLQIRLRSRKRSVDLAPPVAGMRDSAVQESGGGGEPTARLRPAGRALELQGDLLVRTRRRRSQVPRTTVWIDAPVGRLRQRQVDGPALPSCR